MRAFIRSALVGLVAISLLTGAAQAHIGIKPGRAPAGELVTIRFDVENESDTAGTRKIDVKLPSGFNSVSPRAVRGWRVRLRRSGSEITRLIFTAPPRREIPAGHRHRQFAFRIATPDRPGARLVFKAVQTYDDGTVQRWIGSPQDEMPAPTLKLTASRADERTEAPAEERPSETPPAPAAETGDDGSGGVGLAIAIGAAVVAAAAVSAFLMVRRRRATQ